MTAFVEQKIELSFDGSWHVVAWEGSEGFAKGIERLNGELDGKPQGTKAVDFIGTRDGYLHLLELKDFRGSAVEYRNRRRTLALEVALKCRDTLAGIVGLARKPGIDDRERWIADAFSALASRQRQVCVYAVLASDALSPAEPITKRKIKDKSFATHCDDLSHGSTLR